MTWHNTSHHIASNDVTITWPDPATDINTSKHFTSKHKTSPPWNGRRLVHSKEMIWASRWSVALRTFYRQILSVLYSSFPFGNFRPRLVRVLLEYIRWFMIPFFCWLGMKKKIHPKSLHHFSGCFCFRFSTAQEHLGGFDVTLLRSQRWPSDVESATLDGVQSTPLSEDAWMKHKICGWDMFWTWFFWNFWRQFGMFVA